MDIIKQAPRKAFYRQYWYVLAAIPVLIITALAVYKYRNVSFIAFEDELLTDTARRGELTISVRGYGQLVARDIQWIGAEAEGQVKQINVKAGDWTHQGDTLVQLSNPVLMQQLRDAELAYAARKADIKASRVDLDSQLLTMQAEVANTETDYQVAQMDLDAKNALMEKGTQIISRLELEQAVLTVQQYRRRWETQQQRVENQLEFMQAQREVLDTQLLQAENDLHKVQTQVDNLNVRASVKGIVQEMSLALGQTISPAENITRIAQPDQLTAEIQVPELQVNNIQTGMKAVVDTRTSTIEGIVSRIDPRVIGGSVAVEIEMQGTLPPEVRPDLNIEATIEIAHIPETLFIKRPVFARENSNAPLFRLNDKGDIADKIQVRYGRLSSTHVEILEGLSAGDRVIISDTTALNSHDRVLVR